MPKLLSELLSVSQGEMLVQRANKQNRDLVIPKDAYFWRALLDNKNIVENKFVRSLESGVPKRSLWKSYVRPLRVLIPPSEVKYTYQKNVFRYKYFNQIDFKNSIVCTSLSPLALAHAESLDEKVYFCEVQEWFYPPEPRELLEEKVCLPNDELHHEFVDDADECFRQLGVKFSDISRSHIKQWLCDTTRWIHFYMSRLKRMEKRIPMRLWITTSGIIWSRMLADAVMNKGGEVEAHDHGWGCNYSSRNPRAVIETENVSRYITFSKEQANMLDNNRNRFNRVELVSNISFIGVKPTCRSSARSELLKEDLVYVTTLYPTADKISPSPMMSTPIAVDFQYRVLKKLLALGYTVAIKPHPTSTQETPKLFTDLCGVSVIKERFEEICDRAKVLIFDFPFTSTWGFAINSMTPIVYFDFGMADQPDWMTDLIDKRCARIPGWFDKQNRACIDWSQVQLSICASLLKSDRNYAEVLLGKSRS